MKIAIIGAGALGSLIGFYLCEHAETWLLTGRAEQLEAVRKHGLRCERAGVETARRPQIARDPAEIGPCDYVLILVKARQTAHAAEQARALLRRTGAPTLVVTLQNGVGNREILAEALGEQRVSQGVTSLGATALGPGLVRHAGMGATILSSAPDPAAMAALAEVFCASGLPTELHDNLEALIWGKLIVNVGINALSALLRVPNGALAEVPAARALMQRAVAEAAAVAEARNIQLPYCDPQAHVLAIAQASRANRSSMLQDALRGSPTEIDTINGVVVREGRRLGLPTPTNDMLVALVQALDATIAARAE